jgi:hypothetical protein
MAKALTQESLKSWGCQADHDHDAHCSELYFHQRCHPDVPTWTKYDKVTNRAIVVCWECGAEVIRFVVAKTEEG